MLDWTEKHLSFPTLHKYEAKISWIPDSVVIGGPAHTPAQLSHEQGSTFNHDATHC